MKIIILISLFLSLTTTSFTQIKQGQILVGGNITFESIKNENSNSGSYKSTNFFVSPNIGYFIIDKLAGGLRIDIRSYKTTSPTIESHSVNTAVSPFLRYYFLPSPKKVNLFIDVSYIHNKTKYSYNPNPTYYVRAEGYYFFAGPSIFLTDKIALEFTVGYKHTKSDEFGVTKENVFNSGLGLQIHLGKIKTTKSKKV